MIVTNYGWSKALSRADNGEVCLPGCASNNESRLGTLNIRVVLRFQIPFNPPPPAPDPSFTSIFVVHVDR